MSEEQWILGIWGFSTVVEWKDYIKLCIVTTHESYENIKCTRVYKTFRYCYKGGIRDVL